MSNVSETIIDRWFGHADVSRRLWTASLTLIGIGLYFLFLGIFHNVRLIPGFAIAIPGMLMIAWGYGAEVKADPPEVGLLTIWGARSKVVIREGIWFLANFFPFYIWFIPVSIERKNYEIEFDVICKAEKLAGDDPNQVKDSIGGEVDAKTAITFAPDAEAHDEYGIYIGGERLIQFLNSGGEKGVMDILTDVVKEEVRDAALDFTWEQFAELKHVLSASLVSTISGRKVRHLPLGNDGKPLSNGQAQKAPWSITPDTYDRLPAIDHLLDEYVATMGVDGGPENKSARDHLDASILFFLNVIVIAGVADIRDLGINITKFNVTHIFPVGAPADAAASAAAEKQERLKETRDAETENELAQIYFDKAKKNSSPITWDEALKCARVNRGRAKEIIITGSSSGLTDAAAILKS